jgi:hypothetical protein
MSTSLVCVSGMTIQLTPIPPLASLVPPMTNVSSSLSNPSILCVSNALVLVEEDLHAWIETFTCSYSSVSYSVLGMLQGTKVDNVKNLSSTLFTKGKKIITDKTTAQITFSVTTPAQTPPPTSTPDPIKSYTAEMLITVPMQTILNTK